VIKDHLFSNTGGASRLGRYDGLILLIRNPYDAHVAEFNRIHSKSKRGYASNEEFLSESR